MHRVGFHDTTIFNANYLLNGRREHLCIEIIVVVNFHFTTVRHVKFVVIEFYAVDGSVGGTVVNLIVQLVIIILPCYFCYR